MTSTLQRFALGAGAAIIALGLGAGAYAASPQNTAGGPPPRMGPHGPRGMMGPGPGGPMGMLLGPLGRLHMAARALDLTDAQQQQIKGILESHRDEWKALGDRMRAAHQAVQAAIAADPIDEAAIRDKAAAAAAVGGDAAVAAARARAEIFQVLTPEQQAKARTFRDEMRRRMDTFRQQRGQRGPGGQPRLE